MHNSLVGNCLIASPRLADPNFFRSVVLILEHSEEGAFGVILNRRSDCRIQDVMKQFCNHDCDVEGYLYDGGPVEGPLLAIHDQRDFHSCTELEVEPALLLQDFGLFYTAAESQLLELTSRPNAKYKMLDGYAGWEAMQLEAELEIGGWFQSKITKEEVFSDADSLWTEKIRLVGDSILANSLEQAIAVKDPNLN